MGMRPINNVVDVTNYVMLETGQPLHAFDYDLVRGHRIEVRRARPGERLLTLDGVDRELDPEMLMICDAEGPTGIAGIMGGGASEVHAGTKTVLLEVANFLPATIRKTTAKLKLRSEASLRFEKGIGPEMDVVAQHRAIHLLEQVAGGKPAKGLVDVYPGRTGASPITVAAARIEQVLGIAVPRDDVLRILAALGFAVSEPSPGTFAVTPPSWRPDVAMHDDVVEEIGRIHGYDRVPATMLRGMLPPAEVRPVDDLREQVRDALVALGFFEAINYTLVDQRLLDPVVAPGDDLRQRPLAVQNPVASHHRLLRTSLRGSVLHNYAANRAQADGPLRLFEAGVEYIPVEADLPHERPVICAVLGGPRESRWARPSSEALDFFDARGVADAVLAAVRVTATATAAAPFGMLPGHAAELRVESEPIGVVGQVHPATAASLGIDRPVFLVEFWLEPLARVLPERPPYAPPSPYPVARLDLALLVGVDVAAGRVLDLVRNHRARDVRIAGDIFDDYRGRGVPEGKRSLAIQLRLQSSERTLTEDDVARVRDGLLQRLERELGATLRA
jgi:phenylalanyl-tRNA synthetase beta chain